MDTTEEQLHKIRKDIDTVKSAVGRIQKDTHALQKDTHTLNKFIFGNGVKGLVTLSHELNQSLSQLNVTVTSMQYSQQKLQEYATGCLDSEQLKAQKKMLTLKTVGIWVASISVIVSTILSLLGVT